ncbi:MAG: ABC transporter substrate-binding protein [Deltaproteobacteria bacterium]|nr:ABC transporter substrate-binding protein [Deltaproteobacteria bacterium]
MERFFEIAMRSMTFLTVLFLVSALNINKANSIDVFTSQIERKNMNLINIGMTNFPSTIDPISTWHYQEFLVVQSVYETLVRVNEGGNVVSNLAESWTIDESGTHYSFQLRKGAHFNNGNAVTSHDVAVSFARHLWPGSPSVVKDRLASILKGGNTVKKNKIPSGIEEKSNDVVTFHLKAPYAPFLSVLSMPAFSIVSLSGGKPNAPVGSGPMQASYDVNESVWHLRLSDRTATIQPTLSGFDIFPVRDSTEAIKLLEAGALDLVLGLNIQDFSKISLAPHIKVTKTQSVGFLHLFFNNNRSLFLDPGLRKDLGLALTHLAKDRAPDANGFLVFEPHFIPRGIMSPEYYDRNLEPIPPASLRKKWFSKIQGKSLKVVLRRELFSDKFGEELDVVLKSFGFMPQIIFVRGGDYLPILKSGDYDIIAGGYIGNFPDPDGFLDPINRNNSFQYGNIPSDELFESISKVRNLRDGRVRLNEYSRLLKGFESKWYFIPLYRVNAPFLHNDKIQIPDTNFRYECELWKILWRGISPS